MSLLDRLNKKKSLGLKGVISAHMKEITESMIAGHTKKSIYELLKDEGTIKCSYQYFVVVLKKVLAESDPTILKKRSENSESNPQSAYPKRNQFTHDEFTPEELKDIHS